MSNQQQPLELAILVCSSWYSNVPQLRITASISKIEGHNWRHGDIEDMLKTVAFLKGHKWTSMMIRRVYFGNWLRDYSQAMDVGSLKGIPAETIRILVWILSFLSFGYATAEFEVTQERLGVYRPEEHSKSVTERHRLSSLHIESTRSPLQSKIEDDHGTPVYLM